MNAIQSTDHRIEVMKSTRFHCLALMTNIYLKQWIWWISSWLLELIIKRHLS